HLPGYRRQLPQARPIHVHHEDVVVGVVPVGPRLLGHERDPGAVGGSGGVLDVDVVRDDVKTGAVRVGRAAVESEPQIARAVPQDLPAGGPRRSPIVGRVAADVALAGSVGAHDVDLVVA